MRYVSLIAMMFAGSLAVGAADAQTSGRPCDVLANRIAQSPSAIEGRLLSEALFEAAALDCEEIVRGILEKGAAVEARNRRGATALWIAAEHGSSSVVPLLVAAGSSVDHRDLGGATPILAATRASRRRAVDELLKAGADPGIADSQGITPLMAAAFNGDARILDKLIEASVAVDATDRQGKVALIYAAGRAFPKIVDKLVSAQANPDGVWGHGLTPLMWVAGHANDAPAADGVEVAKLLVTAGANLDRQDDRGRDALMIAAERGHREMVAFLLEQGADPAVSDKSGLRAADLAKSEAVRKLLSE